MHSIKLICVASGITVGLSLLYYQYRKRLASNSHWNQCKIGKKVETLKQQPPTTQQPSSQPPPPPLLQQQQPSPPPSKQQQEQLTVPLVANSVKILNKQIKHNGEQSINEKTDVKPPVEQINKEERRQRLNAIIRHLVYPKTSLIVFYELFGDVPIKLQQHPINNVMNYIASLEIGGQTYSANHISKTYAKQNACQHVLRNMLAKEINKQSEKNKESPEMKFGKNYTNSNTKGPIPEDFPWSHFASLAMHNLINQWEINHVVETHNYVQKQSTVIKPKSKTDAKIKINDMINTVQMRRLVSPKSPLMVFNELHWDVLINIQPHHRDASDNAIGYTATFEIGGQTYSANHISKTYAKQKACQNFFRDMLAKEINKQSEKNKVSSEMEFGENYTNLNTKGPTPEDFPWSHFASLAMHNLINQWEINHVVETHNYVQEQSTVIKPQSKNKQIKHIGEQSINEKTDVKPPVERKINKEERRQRLNAIIRHLVYPKASLIVFYELFGDVPIKLQQHPINNVMNYIASLEIGGQTYSANHTSKTYAKQKACQNFFRDMLAKEINKQSEKNKISSEMEFGENYTNLNTKGPTPEDFPWSHFASLAMHNLINQWEINHVVETHNYVQEQSTVIKPQSKTDAKIKINDMINTVQMRRLVSPKSPLMVFNELHWDVLINIQPHHRDASDNAIGYTATFEIGGQTYSANHISKTYAKQKACQNFFRDMLAKEINKQSEKNKESSEMEFGENYTNLNLKRLPTVDFPWSHFASLAMDNLINQWAVKPVVT